MINSAVLVLVALAGAQASIDDLPEGERTPIRCRPAPFYVVDRNVERPKPERYVAGSRIPLPQQRRARPCLLMQAPTAWSPISMRTAD